MRLARVLFLAPLFCGVLFADSTTCSSGTTYSSQLTPVPCSSLTEIFVQIPLPVVAHFGVVGNTVLGDTGHVGFVGLGPYTEFEQIAFSFNDTIALPTAPVGDVLKISAIGLIGSEGGGDQYGFTDYSAGLSAGPFSYSPPGGDCPCR